MLKVGNNIEILIIGLAVAKLITALYDRNLGLESYFRQLSCQCNASVGIYDRRTFIRLITGSVVGNCVGSKQCTNFA